MKCPYVMKKCTKCGEVLHISKFYKRKEGKYGVRNDCKECHNKYCKKWRKDNNDYLVEYSKKHYEELKENIEFKNKRKQYYIKHKENIKEKRMKHHKDNPHIGFNNSVKRRGKEENQGDGITKEQWFEMMNFFDWKCAYSGEYIGGDNKDRRRTIDHIVSLDNGGEHEVWNCVPMLKSYNSSKHINNMLEWYLEQEFFSIKRLTKIYEWRIYAYWKWNGGNNENI